MGIVAAYFQKSPIMILPLIGLVLFIAVFVTASVRAWRRNWTEVARLPLGEDHE